MKKIIKAGPLCASITVEDGETYSLMSIVVCDEEKEELVLNEILLSKIDSPCKEMMDRIFQGENK